MKHVWMIGLLALAACRTQPAGERTSDERRPSGAERTPDVVAPVPPTTGRSGQQNEPYSGYPGPVGPSDAGAADAGTRAIPSDAGALATPPSTAMPGARPLYPDAGADGGARR